MTTTSINHKTILGGVYAAFVYNGLLALLMFMLCRLLFWAFNADLFPDLAASQIPSIAKGGLRFDLSALAYGNALWALLLLLPAKFRYRRGYQSALKCLFAVCNAVLLAANCADFIYFRFTLRRTTSSVFKEFASEQNADALLMQALADYWYVFVIWGAMIAAIVLLYRRARKPPPAASIRANVLFYSVSVVMLAATTGLCIAAMRGGFGRATRPITLVDAGEYVKRPLETAIVQNTPFCFFRTISRKKRDLITYFDTEEELALHYNPVKTPTPTRAFVPRNVVIIVWESMAKEYVGAFNRDLDGGTYRGYTPFVDSLIGRSLTFARSYANGRKSIDGLPAVLASIPSAENPFVLSPYSGNEVNSLGSILKEKGYRTSFFHGAPNGSMGFWGFLHLTGFDRYFGKTEYGNNADYDGIWGIWDEEFLQYFVRELGGMEQPFLSVVFTVSSHHPFKLPRKHEGRWQEGLRPITKCISYTDYSIRRFFEAAQQQAWYANTLFVITADHASDVLHSEYENSVGQMSVPIIYFDPSREIIGADLAGRMLDVVTQQTDIMPTLLGLLGYNQPYLAFGQDALDTALAHPAINYLNGVYHIYEGEYVLFFDGAKSIGLYKIDRGGGLV